MLTSYIIGGFGQPGEEAATKSLAQRCAPTVKRVEGKADHAPIPPAQPFAADIEAMDVTLNGVACGAVIGKNRAPKREAIWLTHKVAPSADMAIAAYRLDRPEILMVERGRAVAKAFECVGLRGPGSPSA
ncbi:hypothetical protein [Sphingomonas qomolangmaensis]|uniref:Uncharacterized protein n=1 Tax=Sphingomonas qomolangmaensis TaxID=2918765 RepID=A0ABY5LF16_9SPHN|nr:hypothetical protein [Sphingomonas qomolangmaensis]UUL84344.1 hypothetical protein NMP03_03920 [Sphingomonas qomolangmaensis]